MKHTPGPWVADFRGGCLAVYPKSRKGDTPGLHSEDDRNIHYSDRGASYNGERWLMSEQAKVDAVLIAAAPELLEALKTINRAFWQQYKDPISEIKAITSIAIARAEGPTGSKE
jgi:hypothetical protein